MKPKQLTDDEVQASGVDVKVCPTKPARGARQPDAGLTSGEQVAADTIIAALPPSGTGPTKVSIATILGAKEAGKAKRAPRHAAAAPVASVGPVHIVNEAIKRAMRDAGFEREGATATETTFKRGDGAVFTTRTEAFWTLTLPGGEPVEGKGAKLLYPCLREPVARAA